jgi:hypothetical protein
MANNPQTVHVIQLRVDYSPAAGTGVAGGQVDTVDVYQSINAIPYIEVGLQPGTETTKVVQVTEALQIQEMEALQRFAFSDRNSVASVDIKLTAGYKESGQIIEGGQTFFGMPVAPSKNVGMGTVNQRLKLYGGEIMFNAFRPFIYGQLPVEANGNPFEGARDQDTNSSNIVQRMVDLVRTRMDNMKRNNNFAHYNSPATYEMARQIHDVNLQQIDRLEMLAAASTEAIYESFSELENLLDNERRAIKYAINKAILDNVLTSTGNFFETLTSFLSAFQLYYVPDPSGLGFGTVRPFRSMLQNTNLVRKVIDTEYLSFSAEDYDYGPIQQILVQGVHQTADSNTEHDDRAAASIVPQLQANTIFVYPESVSVINGNFRPVAPPSWLPADLDVLTRYDTALAKPEDSGGWDITNYTQERDRIHTSINRVLTGPYLNIIREYAHNIYLQSALAAYTAVMRVPLDFSYQVGVRYEISAPDGTLMFAGFLTQLNHKISGIRNNLSAWTTLVFSHVEYGGFELDLN